MSYITLLFAWITYFFLHSFFADLRIKTWVYKQSPGLEKNYRIIYNTFAIVSLGVVTYFHFQFPTAYIWLPTLWLKIVAIALGLAGALVLKLAFKNYDTQEFMGLRQRQVGEEQPTQLNVKGLNALVRHPIYLGAFLLFASLFVYQPTVANVCLLVVVLVYIFVGIQLEERKLVKAYGEAYKTYQRQVKMLIPYLL